MVHIKIKKSQIALGLFIITFFKSLIYLFLAAFLAAFLGAAFLAAFFGAAFLAAFFAVAIFLEFNC
jgi:hypothetical protein